MSFARGKGFGRGSGGLGRKPRTDRDYSRRQEQDAASRYGMQTTVASGATDHAREKMDLRPIPSGTGLAIDEFQGECKTTKHASFSLNEGVLRKAVQQAAVVGKRPFIEVELRGLGVGVPKKWVTLTADDFAELTRRAS